APSGAERDMVVEAAREHKGDALVRLTGIDDASAAGALRGTVLRARRDALRPLPDGPFRAADLIGLHVVDARLGDLGPVESVRHYPSADMLIVGAKMIPMLAAFGVRVEVSAQRILSALPDGFEDL